MRVRSPLSLSFFLIAASASAAEVDFNREIRPILSDHCYTCHGPDGNKRKAYRRLHVKAGAFGEGESGAIAVVPCELEKSQLNRRITSTDKEEVMPPPKEHKKLSATQTELLKRWVQEGAKWSGHWAFEPV